MYKVNYCYSLSELQNLIKMINKIEGTIISVTERDGYTVIYKTRN